MPIDMKRQESELEERESGQLAKKAKQAAVVMLEACPFEWGCEQNTSNKNISSNPRPLELEQKESEQLVKTATGQANLEAARKKDPEQAKLEAARNKNLEQVELEAS